MFPQIIVLATLAIASLGSPIDSHATSFISTNFGDQTGYDLTYEHDETAPILTHHQVPTVIHKVITPIFAKVPVYVKHEEHHEEDDGPAQYEFHYAVEDKHSGDIKSHKESRHGDAVQGEYSLKEADGTTRIVKYTADKKTGFNAVVIRKGHAAHPQVFHKEVEVKKVLVPVDDHHYSYY